MSKGDLISSGEAGALLGISRQRINQLIRSGRLPAQKIGIYYLIRRADLAKVAVRKPGRPWPKSKRKVVQ